MRALFPAAIMAAASLSACALPTMDKEADAKARALYEQIRTGADLAANPDLAADLRTPEAQAQLAAVKSSLPEGAPTAVVNRGFSFNSTNGHTTTTLVHAYSYPDTTVLAETVLTRGKDKAWKIVGFHVKFGDATAPAPPPKPPAVSVEDRPKET